MNYECGLPFSEILAVNINDLIERVNQNKASLIIISGGVGEGKCLAKGTKIIMFDGSIKKVEDIKIGDKLMGIDSLPRTVLNLGNGVDDMYSISQKKGERYVVNSQHILSLKRTRTELYRYDNKYKEQRKRKDRKGEILNISVTDYLKLTKKQKGNWKGYKVPIEFNNKFSKLKIDPYYLGLWLGDGHFDNTAITSMDEEVLNFCKEYTTKLNLRTREVKITNNKAKILFSVNKKGSKNILRQNLKYYNLWKNKHIPTDYKLNSRKVRLQVLAGIIDTDGYVNHGGYVFVNKNKQLAEDVCFLARSLGFYSYISPFINKQFNVTYYKVGISGDCSIIPVKIKRKKVNKRIQKKDVLCTSISVEHIGKGEYFGFEIDGDGLFLLEDFTVTHNTTLLIHILNYINQVMGLNTIDFNGPQLAMGGKEFLRKLRVCYDEKLPCIGYDEAGDFNKRGSLSNFNAMLNRTFETFRAFKCIVILTLPNFNVLDNQLFDNKIPRLLLHVSDRSQEYGNFSGYGLQEMEWLRYWFKKAPIKNYAWSRVYPNIYGHFLDLDKTESVELDKVSRKNKLNILRTSEVKIDGLMPYVEIAGKLGKKVEWVRVVVSNLKIKPARVIKKVRYFDQEAINRLEQHLSDVESNDKRKSNSRPRKDTD